MGNLFGKLMFAILIILSTLGLAAYIIQNAFDDPTMTFVDFFKMLQSR